jgi:hypothetical protein
MPAKKRVSSIAATPNKRLKVASRNTTSQPIELDTQLSLPCISLRKALIEASQAPNFESQAEDAIVAPAEGSDKATIALSKATDEAANENFDAHLEDNFDGIDWARLPQYTKPLALQRSKRSWVYRHGYRVALLKDLSRLFFVCRYCHERKIIDAGGGGIYKTTRSTSTSQRHCENQKCGHGHQAPDRLPVAAVAKESFLRRVLAGGKVSQEVANKLSGFNTQRFRLAAVSWLVENNHPLSEFESPALRQLIAMANLEAESALWASHHSVSRYVVRLYDYLKPRVIQELSQSLSKIHLSFDGWTTKGGKRGFLGVVAHYVDSQGDLKDLPIALPQLTGAHSGERIAEVVCKTLQEFSINQLKVSYFVLDNASNNDSAVLAIAQKMGFNATYRRLRCGPHTLNLIGQVLLWGKDTNAYDNTASELTDKNWFMRDWRRDGALGVLLSVINYIKTPQQYTLFADFQHLAHRELPPDAPADERKTLEPVKPVVTRWNSYYSCFERAVKLQSAVNAYANHHIKRVRDEDMYAQSQGNKLPDAQP